MGPCWHPPCRLTSCRWEQEETGEPREVTQTICPATVVGKLSRNPQLSYIPWRSEHVAMAHHVDSENRVSPWKADPCKGFRWYVVPDHTTLKDRTFHLKIAFLFHKPIWILFSPLTFKSPLGHPWDQIQIWVHMPFFLLFLKIEV